MVKAKNILNLFMHSNLKDECLVSKFRMYFEISCQAQGELQELLVQNLPEFIQLLNSQDPTKKVINDEDGIVQKLFKQHDAV